MHNSIRSALRANASARILAFTFGLPIAIAGNAVHAGALPSHGHFVGGQGSINKANRSLTVKQSSTTGIIDWKSFSVGKHEGVHFDNGSGATLNRVTGGNLSTIAGSLHASGTLYLMNSSGVIISGTGRVVTGGSFVASSGSIDNDAFQDGKLRITNGKAAVVNHGSIVAAHGVRLVGGEVSNDGSIAASHIKFWARRKLDIGGTIIARKDTGAGGAVVAHGHNIDASGKIDASADAAHQNGGTITIDARGTTTVSGNLAAKGGSHSDGGFIETSGQHVHVAKSARISTLAHHGNAGEWLIDPQDFTIAASGGNITGATLSTELQGGDIDIQTNSGSGNGDIFVDDAVSWSSSHTLTLDAYRNIDIAAAITVIGGGGLVLIDADTTGTGVNDGNAADGGDYFAGGNVAFTGGSLSGATLSINAQAYTLLYSMSDVQNINASDGALQGDYALANSLDATGVSGWVPIGINGAGNVGNSGDGFSGIFDGLGNTISNLTVNLGGNSFAAPFGYSSGTIRDIGLVGGSVGGRFDVGGLVGYNVGTIGDSYATGAVSGSSDVGGLVGDNDGTIGDSYATGSVSGGATAGGLVGFNIGTIGDSYATGAVSGSSDIGGLVGENGRMIGDSYATGSVGGSSNVGGFVGQDDSTAGITQSYWDTRTSGIADTTAGAGNVSNDSGITGKTTAQLTAALPGGFDPSVWGNVANQTTPYLLALTGNPQTVYVGDGSDIFNLVFTMAQVQAINASDTALQGNYALANSLDASSTTGWVPIGTDGSGNVGNSGNGFSGVFDGLGNTISNSTVNIGANNFAGLFGYSSGTIRNIGLVGGSVIGGGNVGGLVGYSNGEIDGSYATNAVSGNSDADVGGLAGESLGSISNSYAAGMVSVADGDRMNLSNAGGLVGLNGGTIADSYSLTDIANQSDHSFTNFGGLAGSNDGGTGSVTDSFWDTATSGIASSSQGVGDAANASGVTGLTSAALRSGLPGSFSNTDWGIVAGTSYPYLKSQFAGGGTPEVISGSGGSNFSGISLNTLSAGASIGQMNTFADGSFYLLVAPGTVTNTGVAVYDTSFASTMTFSDAGTTGLKLVDQTLDIVTSDTSATTLGTHVGATLGTTFTNGGPANTTLSGVLGNLEAQLVINSSGAFTVDQAITNEDIAINAGGNLTIAQALSAGEEVMLTAAGSIAESGAGAISTGELTGSSTGTVALNGANQIEFLDNFSTGGHSFSLTDDRSLEATGTLNTGSAALTLTTTTGGIAVENTLKGGTVDLVSASTISESGSGKIDATKLTGSSHSTAALNGANVITDLGTFTSGSTFELTDDHDLTVDGTVNASGHTVELTTKGSGHDIKLDAKIEAKELKLVSAATVTESKSGDIDVTTLTGSAHSSAEMNSSKNTIADLGAFTTGSAFELTDDHALKIDGTVNAGSHTLKLTTVGTKHNLAIDAKIEGGTVDLATTGEATESKAGEIEAKLLNVTADTGIDLTSKKNKIKKLGTHKTKKGPNKVTL